MKKQKSKSLILNQMMSDTDEKLAAIPEFDASGTPIEFTTDYDMYIDGIANIKFIEGDNHIHYPFDKTIATLLVEDELEQRNNEPTMEDIHDNRNKHKS
jgi:hypothetical protein